MKTLNKYLGRIFIIITVIMALLNSAIENIFDLAAENITDKGMMTGALILYLTAVLSVLALGALIFVRMTGKKVEAENNRYNQERSMLFANITHDLKTPITTIMGFSKALHDDIVSETDKKELFSSIYEKSKKVNELLDLMFQYTKLNGLDYELKREDTDIGRLIKEITALYYNEFEQRNMALTIEIPDKGIKRNLDRTEFSRAISNLIINAYQHNESGSKVMIRLEESDGIKISVADNGTPIGDAMQEEIFNPFVCEDASRSSTGGSGLGLAITKKIIEKHEGMITIDSNITGYTKGFVIKLP